MSEDVEIKNLFLPHLQFSGWLLECYSPGVTFNKKDKIPDN